MKDTNFKIRFKDGIKIPKREQDPELAERIKVVRNMSDRNMQDVLRQYSDLRNKIQNCDHGGWCKNQYAQESNLHGDKLIIYTIMYGCNGCNYEGKK